MKDGGTGHGKSGELGDGGTGHGKTRELGDEGTGERGRIILEWLRRLNEEESKGEGGGGN